MQCWAGFTTPAAHFRQVGGSSDRKTLPVAPAGRHYCTTGGQNASGVSCLLVRVMEEAQVAGRPRVILIPYERSGNVFVIHRQMEMVELPSVLSASLPPTQFRSFLTTTFCSDSSGRFRTMRHVHTFVEDQCRQTCLPFHYYSINSASALCSLVSSFLPHLQTIQKQRPRGTDRCSVFPSMNSLNQAGTDSAWMRFVAVPACPRYNM